MVTSRTFCFLLAATLAFAAGCSGSDDEGSDQANQGVGTGTRPGAGRTPSDASTDDADDDEDDCIADKVAYKTCKGGGTDQPPGPGKPVN